MTVYSNNKKAFYDYFILKKVEAGIVLTGEEVKSIREFKIQLKGSFVTFKDNHMILRGAHISKRTGISKFNSFEENQDRILLVSKKQKNYFLNEVKNNGLSLVVLKVYQPTSSKKIKVELALVKGKKNYDKRQSLKEKEISRKILDSY